MIRARFVTRADWVRNPIDAFVLAIDHRNSLRHWYLALTAGTGNASWTGAGDLRSWLRVVCTRIVFDLVRKQPRELPLIEALNHPGGFERIEPKRLLGVPPGGGTFEAVHE